MTLKQEIAAELGGMGAEGTSFKEATYALWSRYIRWAFTNKTKHNVCFLLRTSNALSDAAKEEAGAIFQPYFDRMSAAIEAGEIKEVPVDYLCDVFGAQQSTAIAYALAQKMDAVQLDQHIALSFDLCWGGLEA